MFYLPFLTPNPSSSFCKAYYQPYPSICSSRVRVSSECIEAYTTSGLELIRYAFPSFLRRISCSLAMFSGDVFSKTSASTYSLWTGTLNFSLCSTTLSADFLGLSLGLSLIWLKYWLHAKNRFSIYLCYQKICSHSQWPPNLVVLPHFGHTIGGWTFSSWSSISSLNRLASIMISSVWHII